MLQAAAEEDRAEGQEDVANRIILISDGIETCDADPVASAQALTGLGIEVVVDVVGFDIADSDRAALQQVAEVTGGVYSDARDGAALREVLGQYNEQRVAVAEAVSCQVNAIGEAGSCSSGLSQDVRDHIGDAEIDVARADGDDARASFLIQWMNVAIQEAAQRSRDKREEARVQLEVLRDLYQEAVDRREAFQAGANQKPIGRPIAFDCPFADTGPHAIPPTD